MNLIRIRFPIFGKIKISVSLKRLDQIGFSNRNFEAIGKTFLKADFWRIFKLTRFFKRWLKERILSKPIPKIGISRWSSEIFLAKLEYKSKKLPVAGLININFI